MKKAFGLDVPIRLSEACTPEKCALLLYDMQAAIVPQISTGNDVLRGCETLIHAARESGMRVFHTRHIYLPNRLAGVGQLRRAMVWQRKEEPEETRPFLLPGSAGAQIVPELTPREDEAVIDKITMSAFSGTFLDIALRDAGVNAFLIAGIALEIGIEPTVRQALDLNYIPILIPELCGSKTAEVHERSLATLRETGEVLEASLEEVLSVLRGTGTSA